MNASGDANCSFCGKPRTSARKLIAGPTAYICDECVFLSYNIIKAEEGDSWSREFARTFDSQIAAMKSKGNRE